jgi:hypothetical protein
MMGVKPSLGNDMLRQVVVNTAKGDFNLFKPVATMALSLSLVTLASSPALAQLRKTEPAPAPTRISAASLSATEMAKPRVEFTLMGGYRFMQGTGLNLGSTAAITNTTDVNNAAPGTPPKQNDSRVDAQNVDNTNVTSNLQHGFSLSGSATYWLDNSFGLGLDYTFAHTGAKLDVFKKLALEPMNTQTFDTDPADGTKTSVKSTAAALSGMNFSVFTNNAPFTVGTGGQADYKEFQVTRTQITSHPFNTLLSGNPIFTVDNAGAVFAGQNTFINSNGAVPVSVAADAATNEFTAKGKIGGTRENSTTLHMADALTKTVIGANQRGELHLLAGLTIPMVMQRTISTSVITGEDGTGAATQRVKHVDVANTANNFTQDIAIEAKTQNDSLSTSTMVGPMIGLGGTFKVNDGFRLYGKFGYAPTMVGNRAQSSTVTESLKRTITYSEVGTASGKTEGSVAREFKNNTNSDAAHSALGGDATSLVLGARFSLTDSLGLNVEGVNQTVAGLGYTGINAGVSLGF